ncbi:MAG: hypothetical protein HGB26_01055 [Desulfobulbaceae bacterium]|nr:hypothetical protein [Desulfobulbaceae bacterium]
MKFNNLSPEKKKWAVRGIVAVVVILLAIPVYMKKSDRIRPAEKKKEVIVSDKETFEKSLLTQTKGAIKDLKDDNDAFKNEIKEMMKSATKENRAELEKYKETLAKTTVDQIKSQEQKNQDEIIEKITGEKAQVVKSRGGIMGMAKENAGQNIFNDPKADKRGHKDPGSKAVDGEPKSESIALGITEIKPTEDEKKSGKAGKANKNTKKIVNPTVYLPPSFTEASLLSGVVAPTSDVSNKKPIPMIIRIKDLAVLPNEYKEDLKGCFVIAEGQADLSQERVEARMVTLSCISKDGKSLIDQKVKGWVVDGDGRAGMRGKVVAKFGAHVARVAIAGFMKGFGEAFQESSYNYNSSVYGSTTKTLKNTDPSTLSRAGVGGGIVAVAEDLEKFYLNLAEQTLPCVEIGPAKDITLVFSEGVNLEIKKRT